LEEREPGENFSQCSSVKRRILVEISGSQILDLLYFLDQPLRPRLRKLCFLSPTEGQRTATLQTLLTFILFEFLPVALTGYFNVLEDYANEKQSVSLEVRMNYPHGIMREISIII
jgi:hypothetical protein